METGLRLSGRRAQAARNDRLILDAARAVFVADPEAPIAAVAERAGVGIGALYRRYAGKEDLLRRLCLDGLGSLAAAADAATSDDRDPWVAFALFMRRVVDGDTPFLALRLGGVFGADEELVREAARARELMHRLVARTKAAGALRPDVEVEDLGLVLEQLAAIRAADPERTAQLRRRCLALHLDALHLEAADPLPGPPPRCEEFRERWLSRGAVDSDGSRPSER